MVTIKSRPKNIDYQYVARLPKDAHQALDQVINDFRSMIDWYEDGWPPISDGLAYVTAARMLLKRIDYPIEVAFKDNEITSEFYNEAVRFFEEVRSILIQELFSNGQASSREFGFEPIIYLTDSEIHSIQSKINELRDLIIAADDILPEHKRRLLGRLEKMQLELHSEMSSVDTFLGGMLDVTDALGKSAENLSPVAQLFRDIFESIWGRRRRSEEISRDDYPRLPGESDQ